MATLTFWLAEQHDDHNCYNVIARTKRDCLAQVAQRPHMTFAPPRKVSITYRDAFDLFDMATSEGGGRLA